MSKTDTDFIIEAYKQMVDSLNDVNKSLSELVVAQQQTILRLQGLQTPPPVSR